MGIIELLSIAVGLSMDAFAVSACIGLGLSVNTDGTKTKNISKSRVSRVNLKSGAIVGLYFGFFQAAMPLIGYFAGVWFSDKISAIGDWIAFLLLLFVGLKMIKESFGKSGENGECGADNPLRIKKMLPLAFATSIDALAVGVSFAFMSVNIFPAVSLIGAVTFILSAAGVKIGGIFGAKFKSKAELAGGIVLVLIGVKILAEHFIAK